jgi:hypothetical protein
MYSSTTGFQASIVVINRLLEDGFLNCRKRKKKAFIVLSMLQFEWQKSDLKGNA